MPDQLAPWWAAPHHRGSRVAARLACLLAAPLIALGSSSPARSDRLAIGEAARARYVVAVAGPLHAVLAADAAADATLGARGDLRDAQVRAAWQTTIHVIDTQRRNLAEISEDLPRGLRELHAQLLDALSELADRYTLLASAAAAAGAALRKTLAAAARAHDAFRQRLAQYVDACARAGMHLETGS